MQSIYTFKTVEFMTAEQKCKILNLWIRFLKNGLQRQDFTKELYRYVMNVGGFIAHTDIHGFYAEYFERGDDKIRFLKHFDIARMRGNTLVEIPLTGDYGDLNEAMILEAQKYLPVLYAGAAAEQKRLDLRIAERLLSRHGLTLDAAVKPVERPNAQPSRAPQETQANLFN